MHLNEMIYYEENGRTTRETSYQCCIMRKVARLAVAVEGRLYVFLDSAVRMSRTLLPGTKRSDIGEFDCMISLIWLTAATLKFSL